MVLSAIVPGTPEHAHPPLEGAVANMWGVRLAESITSIGRVWQSAMVP